MFIDYFVFSTYDWVLLCRGTLIIAISGLALFAGMTGRACCVMGLGDATP